MIAYEYNMEVLKCALCGETLLYKYYKAVVNINSTQKEFYLCEFCVDVLVNRASFADRRKFSYNTNYKSDRINVQKHVKISSLKIPPDKIEYVMFVFIGKKE